MFLKIKNKYSVIIFLIIAMVLLFVSVFLMLSVKPLDRVIKVDSERTENVGKEIKCDLHKNLNKLKFGESNLEDVVNLLGEPVEYLWGNQKFMKSNLPSRYIANYGDGFEVLMYNGKVFELRFEYKDIVEYKNIRIGSDLDDVVKGIGNPDKEIDGSIVDYFENGVLYTNVNGETNISYYMRIEKGVRIFFAFNKVTSIYFVQHKG